MLATLTIVGYNFTARDLNWLSYHQMAEAFKFGYAQRMKLGDPAFSTTVNQVFTEILRAERVAHKHK